MATPYKGMASSDTRYIPRKLGEIITVNIVGTSDRVNYYFVEIKIDFENNKATLSDYNASPYLSVYYR